MDFEPSYIVRFLEERGVNYLFHANTVATSCSLIRLGALCSRYCVETSNEIQTVQSSDELDHEYGLWDCVFLDSVDIHRRASQRNNYGPILFMMRASILEQTEGKIVRITKLNPTKWAGISEEERWFQNCEELENGFAVGNFDQMIVVPNAGKSLIFNEKLRVVIIDDPQEDVDGENGYLLAERSIKEAATLSNVTLANVKLRECVAECSCVKHYKSNSKLLSNFFRPTISAM